MKKLTLLLIPLMLFGLAGCGDREISEVGDDIYAAPEEETSDENYAEPQVNGPAELPNVEGPTSPPPSD